MTECYDDRPLSRRAMMLQAGLCAGVAAVAAASPGNVQAEPKGSQVPGNSAGPFGYCLNTGTIRGQKLPLAEEVEIAAKSGYQAIEPWVQEIEDHVKQGGSLADLRKRIADRGLIVPSAIGFADWINDDDQRRRAGMEQMKRDMELVASIGGKRIAAPPVGAYRTLNMSLLTVAQRYRSVLQLGRQAGIVPQLELWGGSKTLSRLGEIAFVVVEAAHDDACALLDVFHVYKGGSEFAGIRKFNGDALHMFHVNDYPAQPPRETATDADRVYPGDGCAPLLGLLRDLQAIGYRGFLSLELFNRQYWKQDALAVARTGLEKIKALVAKARA